MSRRLWMLGLALLSVACGPTVSSTDDGGQNEGSGSDGSSSGVGDTTGSSSSGTTDVVTTSSGPSTTGSGSTAASESSSSTGSALAPCGCPEDPDTFPSDFSRFCEDVERICPSLDFACEGKDFELDPEPCLDVLGRLEAEDVEALDCQLAGLQAEDPGDYAIGLSWMGGYGRRNRAVLVDTSQQATGFEWAYVDIPGPPTVTVGQSVATDAAACAAIRDANERLRCAWAMYVLPEELVCPR